MKCPSCGTLSANVYKCDHCGDVRCGFSCCHGSMGGQKGGAGLVITCRVCKKEKYKKL